LITSPDGGVVWKTGTWEEHLKLNSSLTVASGLVFAFSPDARWLVNSRSNCELQLWKTESKELLATLKDPSQMRFESVAISRDNFEIYTISRGKRGILSTWNLHALGSQVYERTGIDIFPEVDQHRDRALDDLELKNNERLEVVENELLLGLTAGKLNNDGNKLIDAGEWKQGLSMLERAAAKSPGNARILNSLSWNLLICPEDLRAPDKSLELAKKAVEIDGQAIYLNTLGTAQYRAGLYTEAVETLRRSLGDGSADAAAFDYWVLACCHAKLGEREQTEQMYRGGLAAEERVRGLVNEVWLREMKLFREEAEAAIGELKK
jgi:tetratricopeptide (TPR) repeat protein